MTTQTKTFSEAEIKSGETITRTFTFEAAHRLLNHPGKCRYLHGHSYTAFITVCRMTQAELAGYFVCSDHLPEILKKWDDLGMVADFALLKDGIGEWIQSNWDHNTLLHHQDPLLAIQSNISMLIGRTPYIMEYGNPTAENMAKELHKIANDNLSKYGLKVTQVVIQETRNCMACYSEKPYTGE